ncbi:DUF7535 family protein [Halomarina ordinaria]|uniref:Uncharacterized protein n=1 Tax=Halomarina ordinaria TaxID=3033939 RepID=A0ABD5UCN3_9EURY|nr:hypothetical protein [Halomarina sp. PSRA2]
MSQEPESDGLATRAIDTVTPGYFGRRDVEMDAIGWALFLGLVILLVPLLPFLVIVWAISKLFEQGASRRTG